MTTTVLTNAVWLHDGSDLTGVANQIGLNYGREALDDTVMGMKARSNKGGLFVLEFSGAGLVDPSGPDGDVFARIGSNTATGVLQMSQVPDDGTVGYAFKALAARYEQGAQVGALLGFSASGAGRSGAPLVRGTILHPKAEQTTNTRDGTPRQIGAVATNSAVYGALNVVSVTGTTPTIDVIVESDSASNFPSPTTRLTFPQLTAPGSGWQSTNGPITDTWWRVGITISGTGPQFLCQALVGII